jgi:hypothetical protein
MNFRNKLIFYGEQLLAHAQPPSWRTTPFRLSATAYSIYSQLPSISGGRLLHPQPKDEDEMGRACSTNGGEEECI